MRIHQDGSIDRFVAFRAVIVVTILLCGQQQQIFVSASSSSPSRSSSSLTEKVGRQFRRWTNLSGLFGSSTSSSIAPYDRISGQAVFSVTTAWGGPYLNVEKTLTQEELIDTQRLNERRRKQNKFVAESISEEQIISKMIALYYLDPDDAIAAHSEMKQMENMQSSDIRITTCSLSKALRQTSNLGHGLLTGMINPDPSTGEIMYEDGAILRYKLVPPKRQLYYAARCKGRERVGLMMPPSDEQKKDNNMDITTSGLDAQLAVVGNPAIASQNAQRRRSKKDTLLKFTGGKKKRNEDGKVETSRSVSETVATSKATASASAKDAPHMEGYTGIPVFYCPRMHHRPPLLKRLTTGTTQQIPMFFDYEDMTKAWNKVRRSTKQQSSSSKLPILPPDAEVFNLWDLLTSMDRENYMLRRQQSFNKSNWSSTLKSSILGPFENRWIACNSNPSKKTSTSKLPPVKLQDIKFIPSSRNISFKENTSKRGNNKARLRPMR